MRKPFSCPDTIFCVEESISPAASPHRGLVMHAKKCCHGMPSSGSLKNYKFKFLLLSLVHWQFQTDDPQFVPEGLIDNNAASAFGLGFCLLSRSGHVFHMAWETMIKSYIIALWGWFSWDLLPVTCCDYRSLHTTDVSVIVTITITSNLY